METFKRIIWKTPALRLLIAALFIYAGAAKLLDVPTFSAQLQRFGAGNPTLVAVVAHYLPFIELTCGLALAVKRFTAGAISLCMGLLLVFEAGLAHAWASGVQEDCGCFGSLLGGSNIPMAFVRNLGLMVVVGVVLARECLQFGRSIP